MRDVLSSITELLDAGLDALLCQVVETKGSTPQKAGALMLVNPDGGQVGTLGGGCVENEVKQKAIRRLGQPGAEKHSFVLDHDYAWADGLICGGKMVILTEAFRGPEASSYFRAYRDLIDAGLGLIEAVAVDPDRCGAPGLGSRWLFGPEGRLVSSLPGGSPPPGVLELIEPVHRRPRLASRNGVAILPVLPRIRLLIVGAGHVGQAVSRLASEADFDVWVVDDRSRYANAERFPEARRIVVGPIEEVLPALEVTPHTFALVVTRGHGHDQEALYHLAPTPAAYVGLIGSRRKIRLIFDGLRGLGVAERHLARVTAPIGVPIGSQSVPEIAVSVVAQLIARRNLGPEAVPTNDFSRPVDAPDEPGSQAEADPAGAVGS
ncbi:XdhC family protein [Tautonia sociabilis]|uniref:XdhC/CoxI family protein n=1 Tax=Tautonia sociabilis TaxID=2080755 RepID=A0A432MKE7_9BACT|nr:XdhC/CoxI family protein [Tautonia sociabilis]RUL87882.1 XdhC/CoxI family protein [Tautonia sociabilis]